MASGTKYPLSAALLKPSAHLIRFREFCGEYRTTKPTASLNEVQIAYQISQNKRLAKAEAN